MKLRIVVGVLSLSILGVWACQGEQPPAEQPGEQPKAAAGGEKPGAATAAPQPAAQPTPAAEAPKPPEVSPKEIVEQAVAAAKAKDEAKLATLVSGDLSAEGAKEHLTAILAGGAAGEPKVEGDKGQVAITEGKGKKAKVIEVPLVKTADGWKIDAAAFLEKNPSKAAKAAKKGGGKKVAKTKKGK